MSKGPDTYKEDPVKKMSTKDIEAQIVAEGKFSFRLDDSIKPGDELDFLHNFLELHARNKIENFNPDDIICYSDKLGMLKFSYRAEVTDDTFFIKTNPATIYFWSDEKKQNTLGVIYYKDDKLFIVRSIKKNGFEDKLPE